MPSYKLWYIERHVKISDTEVWMDSTIAGGTTLEEAEKGVQWPEISGSFNGREATDSEYQTYYDNLESAAKDLGVK